MTDAAVAAAAVVVVVVGGRVGEGQIVGAAREEAMVKRAEARGGSGVAKGRQAVAGAIVAGEDQSWEAGDRK